MSDNKRGDIWLGASGLVINSEGQWLVVRKTYGGLKGMWSIPAGFVDGGETADCAAIREVKEETGIDCRLEGMIGFRTGVLNGEISDNMAIFHLVPTVEGQVFVADQREIAEVAWKTPAELKVDKDVSTLLYEIAEKVIESGFAEIVNINPGDQFGYTAYKMFFKK
ncbi:NUDIX domain-containing protein [Sporosarcina limicola]|uniref:ADP-ribose pyrophosphatase YjhB (NUDIX family) n=1 Tax=Sporosarcina limicola TaxID=34101 RepID=A0A927R7V2_9BACL|nr:NUDIX hydrolase [Sporosarcina limicola]MBE1556364.1 ADP-ribose pyrophosphatase YjhB (NUDIX family) [Sporosarcina limicola]